MIEWVYNDEEKGREKGPKRRIQKEMMQQTNWLRVYKRMTTKAIDIKINSVSLSPNSFMSMSQTLLLYVNV